MKEVKEFPDPIIVLGFPRSGTSMVAGLFALHGVWHGKCRPADPRNPKGFYENQALMNLIRNRLGEDTFTRKAVVQVLKEQGYRPEQGHWMMKHSVVTKWDRWFKIGFAPHFVMVRRAMEDIANSQLKVDEYCFQTRGRGKNRPAKKRVESGLPKTLEIFKVIEEKHNGVYIDSERIVQGDLGQLEDAFGRFGLEIDSKIITEFVDPKLWKRERYSK